LVIRKSTERGLDIVNERVELKGIFGESMDIDVRGIV
jgi:hypothetical protein